MTYWLLCFGCIASAAINWVQIIRAQKVYERIEELELLLIRIELLCEDSDSDPGETLMTVLDDVRRGNPLRVKVNG